MAFIGLLNRDRRLLGGQDGYFVVSGYRCSVESPDGHMVVFMIMDPSRKCIHGSWWCDEWSGGFNEVMLSYCRPGFGVTLNKEGLERPYTRSQKQVRIANTSFCMKPDKGC